MKNIVARLEQIRAGAPKTAPNVRVLAGYAGHSDCRLASLGFAAGVDFDRLLAGTVYEGAYGQSPFAFARGSNFERLVKARNYEAFFSLLRGRMGFSPREARTLNLRHLYANNRSGLRLRAAATAKVLARILRHHRGTPNLIDGAVLTATIGGVDAYFEADALSARLGDKIHAGEVKSFPVVDGRADPVNLGAALDQVSVYILLAKRLVAEMGGDHEMVSPQAMIVTPRNATLTPILSVKDVSARISRTERVLRSVPDAISIANELGEKDNFGAVADPGKPSSQRIEALEQLADRVGTAYRPSCLSTCGNARFCRARAAQAGLPELIGPAAVRQLPGVVSLQRAADLADGAAASDKEAPAAARLVRAGRLYDAAGEWPAADRRMAS